MVHVCQVGRAPVVSNSPRTLPNPTTKIARLCDFQSCENSGAFPKRSSLSSIPMDSITRLNNCHQPPRNGCIPKSLGEITPAETHSDLSVNCTRQRTCVQLSILHDENIQCSQSHKEPNAAFWFTV